MIYSDPRYTRFVIYKSSTIKADGEITDRMLLAEFPNLQKSQEWLKRRIDSEGAQAISEYYIAEEFKHTYASEWHEINQSY